jgi:hypothetical protein
MKSVKGGQGPVWAVAPLIINIINFIGYMASRFETGISRSRNGSNNHSSVIMKFLFSNIFEGKEK